MQLKYYTFFSPIDAPVEGGDLRSTMYAGIISNFGWEQCELLAQSTCVNRPLDSLCIQTWYGKFKNDSTKHDMYPNEINMELFLYFVFVTRCRVVLY